MNSNLTVGANLRRERGRACIVPGDWFRRIWIAGVVLATPAIAVTPAAAETFECVIEPSIVVQVGGPVTGLLAEVQVKRGDKIARDQVIARLSSRVEKATIKLLTEKAINTAEVDAQKARAALAIKRAERAQQLADRKITSQDQLEESLAQMEVVTRELIMAKMRLRVAKLELERAKTVLDQRTIRSPIDGIVVSRNLYSGEFLDQNGKVATIAQLDPLNAEAFLPVAFFGKVEVGMEVEVTPNPPLQSKYIGTVSVVDRVFDAASSTFGVRINIPNPDLKIPAGQRCKVNIAGLSN